MESPSPTEVIRWASRDDACFLAWAILAATRSHVQKGWFDIVLDKPEPFCLDYLRALTLTPTPSWWHYSRFLVAEVNGTPAAALAAFRAGDGYPLSQAAMYEVAQSRGITDDEQTAMWQRGAYIFSCTIEVGGDDDWAIENVATLPEYRGQGLAMRLLERALDEGRRAGLRQARIPVMIGNDAAERTYFKAGFRVAAEKRDPAFEAATGSPGLRLLTREI
jgi:ribosomal protein S18 acetylase RimI-like enzyme